MLSSQFSDQTPLFHAEDQVCVQTTAPIDRYFDYKLAPEQTATIGQLVEVPFGKRLLMGVIRGKGTQEIAPSKLKYIEKIHETAPLSAAYLRFLDLLKNYTLSSCGAVGRLFLPAADLLKPEKIERLYARTSAPLPTSLRMTPTRKKLFDFLLPERGFLSATTIKEETGVSKTSLEALVDLNLIQIEEKQPLAKAPQLIPDYRSISLSDEQEKAASTLCNLVHQQEFAPCLLDGITGSGKTEVYSEAIAAALEDGKQVLVLLPEIALSTQLIARFTQRFGAAPLAWHSELSSPQRRHTWQTVQNGSAQLIVGARSALFLPFQKLGLIVVDEEHETAFKQEEGVRYHGRDMAIARAKYENVPIILASATPSIETVQNAQSGKYHHLQLTARHGQAGLPQITLIDLRQEKLPPRRFISHTLEQAVQNCLSQNKQTMLYLNRRGYAPLTLCRACGHRIQCPQCSAWLVEHRKYNRLICHHCGHGMPKPEKCPNCFEEESLTACGPGVERIAEEAQHLFPDARIELMVSDLFSSTTAFSELIQKMQNQEIDILVGTQLMAKGHNFPFLTHVGVIDADLGLEGGDLRASERTFQLLHQVSGRAGRADDKGHVYLQTYLPDHPVMQALKAEDRDGFLAIETKERSDATMPPFGRLASVILSGPNEEELDLFCQKLAQHAPSFKEVLVLGPAPAPLAFLRGRHRRRFLIRAHRNVHLQKVLKDWIFPLTPPKTIRCHIDIDPYNFM